MAGDDRPLILTLKLDAASFATLDALRQRHFPPGLNHLAAHLTLFHQLPGGDYDEIMISLAEAARRPPMMLCFDGLRSLGRGVAFTMIAPELVAMRAELAGVFSRSLTAQDRQGFRPHVTIQNKVAAETAKMLHERLKASFTPWTGKGEALLLWRYLGGPWSLEAELSFQP